MPTPLTPNSKVVKAIVSHIETGIPISPVNYSLSPDEIKRITAVFHLYKVWRDNPMVDKTVFLKETHHRRTQDIANDLYCFDVIKSMSVDLLKTKDDLLLLQQRAALKAYKAAEATGDPAMMLKAAKQLGDIIKEMPEKREIRTNELGDFYSNDIRDIAPDFQPVASDARRQMIKKYGGTPDHNTQLVQDKVERLKQRRMLDLEDME